MMVHRCGRDLVTVDDIDRSSYRRARRRFIVPAWRENGCGQGGSGGAVGNSWTIHLSHLLEPNGALAPLTGRGRRLAEYWTQIVAQASNCDQPTTLRCRRRPGRRPCAGQLTIFFDVDNNDVLWFCPVCDDQGRISGWENSFWDNGNLTEITS